MYLITLKLKVGGLQLGLGFVVSETGRRCTRAIGIATEAGGAGPLFRILSVTNLFLAENI